MSRRIILGNGINSRIGVIDLSVDAIKEKIQINIVRYGY